MGMVKHFPCSFPSCSTRPIFNHLFSPVTELSSNPTIRLHLAELYDTLLEWNLLWIVEPYSIAEIAYVAKTVGQEREAVEAKCHSVAIVFM